MNKIKAKRIQKNNLLWKYLLLFLLLFYFLILEYKIFLRLIKQIYFQSNKNKENLMNNNITNPQTNNYNELKNNSF